jgi:hypothetical protein
VTHMDILASLALLVLAIHYKDAKDAKRDNKAKGAKRANNTPCMRERLRLLTPPRVAPATAALEILLGASCHVSVTRARRGARNSADSQARARGTHATVYRVPGLRAGRGPASAACSPLPGALLWAALDVRRGE